MEPGWMQVIVIVGINLISLGIFVGIIKTDIKWIKEALNLIREWGNTHEALDQKRFDEQASARHALRNEVNSQMLELRRDLNQLAKDHR